MLKFGCTFANLAKIRRHESTSAKFFPFSETDKDLLHKTREDMVGCPSTVFTRKAVFDETFNRNSKNISKTIDGIDASQLYLHTISQPLPTVLYTRWAYDTESNRYKPQQNKWRIFEYVFMSFFQRQRHDCEIDSFYTTRTQKKKKYFRANGFCAL